MCLINKTGDYDLCVKNASFILAKIDQPVNSPQGVLGLARGADGKGYVDMLKE